MFISREIRNRSSKFYHIGLKKIGTICQWEKNQTTRKGNVAVILNGSTIDNQCIIDYFNRYKRAAYICEISNGKTKPLLIHIGWENNNVIKKTLRNPCDHHR